MKRISLWLLLVVAMQASCLADTTNAPAGDERIARMLARYHELHSVTELPRSVIKLCADSHGRLADLGQRWDASDVISGKNIPQHRLIWAVTNNRNYIVHYERGGRAHTFITLIVEMKVGGVDTASIQSARMGMPYKDFRAFLESLYNKKKEQSRFLLSSM